MAETLTCSAVHVYVMRLVLMRLMRVCLCLCVCLSLRVHSLAIASGGNIIVVVVEYSVRMCRRGSVSGEAFDAIASLSQLDWLVHVTPDPVQLTGSSRSPGARAPPAASSCLPHGSQGAPRGAAHPILARTLALTYTASHSHCLALPLWVATHPIAPPGAQKARGGQQAAQEARGHLRGYLCSKVTTANLALSMP